MYHYEGRYFKIWYKDIDSEHWCHLVMTVDGVIIREKSVRKAWLNDQSFADTCKNWEKMIEDHLAVPDYSQTYFSSYYYEDKKGLSDKAIIFRYMHSVGQPYYRSKDNVLLNVSVFSEEGCHVLNTWLKPLKISLETKNEDSCIVHFDGESFTLSYNITKGWKSNFLDLDGAREFHVSKESLIEIAHYIILMTHFYKARKDEGFAEKIRMQSAVRQKVADIQLKAAQKFWDELRMPGMLTVNLKQANVFKYECPFLKFELSLDNTVAEIRREIYKLACTMVLLAENPCIKVGATKSKDIRNAALRIKPHLDEFRKLHKMKQPW